MKILKKVVLAFLVAVSLGAVSTTAMAEASDGRISYAPADALELIIKKVQIAIEAIDKGATGEEAAKQIKAALDATKEFYASDRIGGAVQRANNTLKTARTHAKAEALQEAEQELRNALKMFQDMQGML